MSDQEQRDLLPDDELNADVEAFKTSISSTTTAEIPASKRLTPRPKRTVPTIEEPPQGDTLFGLVFGATMSVLAGTAAFGVVAAVVLAIIVPPWYRSLEPRYQTIWCNRVSALCDLKEERDTDDIYALSVDQTAAVQTANALIATPTATLTATLVPTDVPTIAPTTEFTPTPTIEPTITPTFTPSASPTPTATPIRLPQQATLRLDELKWEQQGWNNCGPTTVTIGLTYFGYNRNQYTAANWLKPDPEDTNVSPDQMVDFVNNEAGPDLGVRAMYRVGGTSEILKLLIVNDFPVIVERGIVLEDEGWMGHYSLVVGYDESTSEYLLFDSWYGYNGGEGRRFAMDFIEEGWQQFNYTFIVLYPLARQPELNALLGDYATLEQSAQIASNIARQEASVDQQDKWAWFNLGSSLTLMGQYQDAANAFDYARTLNLPFRMMWYQFGPYIAYYNIGRYDDVLGLALASERTTPYVEEIYYYRGLVYAAQGNANSAVFQFDRALEYNSNFTPAADAKAQVLQGRFVAPTG